MDTQGITPKKKPTKIEEMSKEQIRQAILKKRECNAKALTIVESLLEKGISQEYLLQCLPDINQNHFEDVIEERAILHTCGYPICANDLSEKDIPKQKYRISIKTNKVYDITARKSFCSNACYKAAMFVKKQMLTSPLWFREYEDIPRFSLLVEDHIGSLGQEIDVSLIEKLSVKPKFTSINDFTKASLNEMNDNQVPESESTLKQIEGKSGTENSRKLEEGNLDVINTPRTQENNSDLIPEQDNIKSESTPEQNETSTNTKKDNPTKKTVKNPLSIVGEIVEKPERKVDPLLLKKPDLKIIETKSNTQSVKLSKEPQSAKKITTKKQPAITALTIEIEKCLAEWFTLDTLIFLFGEEKVKEMVTDKGECIKEYLNNYAKSIFYTSNTYDQYQALCRKLNMLELEDRKFDSETLKRESKPLPDYSILQEESKKMQLKVKAFFSGATEIPEVDNIEEKPSNTEENITQLPLVDKNAQNALRRRIVCQHLNKVLPDLLRSLGLLTLTISSDVRLMVNTFKLKANNIMFKPIQWTLIAIIIIKLLSLRDRRLEYLLERPMAYEHMQLLLLSYKQDGGYLNRLISWLTDVDRLLDTNDTQLTIE